MVKIPNPDEMAMPQLASAGNPATIDINVASRIGQAGRAMGSAIASLGEIGSAIGEAVGRVQGVNDAMAESNQQMALVTAYDDIDKDLRAKDDGTGTVWQQATPRYNEAWAKVKQDYQITDPLKAQRAEQRAFNMTRERDIASAHNYQKGARTTFLNTYSGNVAGIADLITKGEITPQSLEDRWKALEGNLEAMDGQVMTRADKIAAAKQARATIARSIYNSPKLLTEEKRNEFFGRVGASRYDVEDLPGPGQSVPGQQSGGRQSSYTNNGVPVAGSMAGKTWDQIPEGPNRKYLADRPGGGKHAGWDIPGKVGDPALALTGGTVLRTTVGNGYGNMVDVEAPDGTVHRFAHLDTIGVQQGQKLQPGSPVGTVGYTGNAGRNFPHLHIEVFKDKGIYGQADRAGNSRANAHMRIDARDYYAPASKVAGNDNVANVSNSAAPSVAGGIKTTLTAYAPKRGGDDMQGGYASSKPGPGDDPKDPKTWTVKTLEDVATGRSQYVTIAGDPSQYGKTYTIPEIAYIDASGKQQILRNVKAVVHDTGSAFKGKPEGRFDVAVARDVDEATRNANHAAWKKAGVTFIPEGQGTQVAQSPPVQQRNIAQAAGAQPVRTASAGAPDPELVKWLDASKRGGQAANPNTIPTPAGAQPAAKISALAQSLGEDTEKAVASALAEDPNMPLTKVLSAAEIAKFKTDAGLNDNDNLNELTVSEFSKLAGDEGDDTLNDPAIEGEAGGVPITDDNNDPGTVDRGPDGTGTYPGLNDPRLGTGGRSRLPPPPVLPRGRLAPGQLFPIETPMGTFMLRSEDLNEIPEKQRHEDAVRAYEQLRRKQKDQAVAAEVYMKDNEVSMELHGKPAAGSIQSVIDAAAPEKSARRVKHDTRMALAKKVYDVMQDAANLSDQDAADAVENLKPKPGTNGQALANDIYEKAKEKVNAMIGERKTDPGGAAEAAKLVKDIRGTFPGGQPRKVEDQMALINARMMTQALWEIGEDARRPLPKAEADAIGQPLRGVMGDAESYLNGIKAVHAGILKRYGDKHAGLILGQVVDQLKRSKEEKDILMPVLKEYVEKGNISPTTLSEIRKKNAAPADALPTSEPPEGPSMLDRIWNAGKSISDIFPTYDAAPKTNVPRVYNDISVVPPKARKVLQQNPQTWRTFEETFKLRPGASSQILFGTLYSTDKASKGDAAGRGAPIDLNN